MANLLSSERCSMKLHFDKVGIIEFIGVSRGASGTSIAVPGLKIQLDAGMNVTQNTPEAVFITHGHSDHCSRLTHFTSREKVPRFYMPPEIVEFVDNFLHASQELSWNERLEKGSYQDNHISLPSNPGDTLTCFSSKNKDLGAHVIECHHAGTPCVGYAFFTMTKRLLPHLQGAEKKALGEMRKKGAPVSEEVKVPLFIFLGDTTAKVFDPGSPHSVIPYFMEGWNVIFVECSFIMDEDEVNSIRTGHMHWKHLKPIVLANPQVTFVLIHFSRRYKAKTIESFFEKENVKNIRLFIGPDDNLDSLVHIIE